MSERNEHFRGAAKLTYDRISNIDSLFFDYWGYFDTSEDAIVPVLAECIYDLIKQSCTAINNAQMEQGVRLHPNTMLRVIPDLTEWPEE